MSTVQGRNEQLSPVPEQPARLWIGSEDTCFSFSSLHRLALISRNKRFGLAWFVLGVAAVGICLKLACLCKAGTGPGSGKKSLQVLITRFCRLIDRSAMG